MEEKRKSIFDFVMERLEAEGLLDQYEHNCNPSPCECKRTYQEYISEEQRSWITSLDDDDVNYYLKMKSKIEAKDFRYSQYRTLNSSESFRAAGFYFYIDGVILY